jgi:hypothetical protein
LNSCKMCCREFAGNSACSAQHGTPNLNCERKVSVLSLENGCTVWAHSALVLYVVHFLLMTR